MPHRTHTPASLEGCVTLLPLGRGWKDSVVFKIRANLSNMGWQGTLGLSPPGLEAGIGVPGDEKRVGTLSFLPAGVGGDGEVLPYTGESSPFHLWGGGWGGIRLASAAWRAQV